MSGLLRAVREKHVPEEEIRFGVILNGGVSLAVWMGGAVLELDRLVKAGSAEPEHAAAGRHPVYRSLLALAGCTARADVIAGTSAGGINGAALALCQANAGARMSSLRDVWVEQGRIESLMRQPFRGAPTSLLKGDDFFLPQLNDALARLARPGAVLGPERAPIDLSITTTVLGGNQTVTVDSMGQALPQRLHAGRFHWRRLPGTKPADDPFAAGNIGRTADRLALASRSTSSFPLAFEPSFVPVNSPRHGEPEAGEAPSEAQRLHPDMAGVVDAWGGEAGRRDRSRFVVDGGLLANTPTRHALAAVEAMPVSGPVRRVMLLVYPHAEPPGADPGAQPDDVPTVLRTVAGLMDALTAQGSRTFVDELMEHNKAAAGRRGSRSDLVALYGEPGGLHLLTTAIYPQYRRLRLWRAARDLADRTTHHSAGRTGQDGAAASALPAGWNYERVRRAAETAQSDWEQTTPGRAVPYVPDSPPPASGTATEGGWEWGVSAAVGVVEAVGDLLRRLVWVLPHDEDYRTVHDARAGVSLVGMQLADLRREADDRWEHGVLATLMPDETYWRLRITAYGRSLLGTRNDAALTMLIAEVARREAGVPGAPLERETEVTDALTQALTTPVPGRIGHDVTGNVKLAVRHLESVLPVLDRYCRSAEHDSPDQQVQELRRWGDLLRPNGHTPTPAVLLSRLLQLEVVGTALGDEMPSGLTIPLEVVQLSAQTRNAFAQHTRTGDDKLGGMSVHRFGGLLKRSWRVNDWTWGRIDAATSLSSVVLHPARIRRAAVLSGYLTSLRDLAGDLRRDPDDDLRDAYSITLAELAHDTVAEIVGEIFHPCLLEDPDPRITHLVLRAEDELAPVFDLDVPLEDLDASLPALADLFAWAVHLDVVPSELPALARSVRADGVEGANQRSRGMLFLSENEPLLRRLDARAATPGSSASGASWSAASSSVSGRRDRAAAAADGWAALAAFDRAGIGGEPLAEEGGSDQMIRTATTAAAVAATLVDSPRSGLGAVRFVTRPVRGAMLLPFWIVTGLSSRSVLGRGLSTIGLALGGVMLALALFGVLPSSLTGPAAALGAGTLLSAFAFGALRSGTLLHGLVLLTPVVPLTAFAVAQAREPARTVDGVLVPVAAERGVGVLFAVLALVVGLMVLGSLPATTGSVLGALDRLADRQRVPDLGPGWAYAVLRRTLGVGAVLARAVPVLVVGGLAVLLATWLSGSGWDRSLAWFTGHAGLVTALALVLVAAGLAVSFVLGRQLQILRPSAGSRAWRFQPLAHPAGTTAGWSVLYGTAYLVLARVLIAEADRLGEVWLKSLLVTSVVLGVTLVLVVPLWLPLRAARRMWTAELVRAARFGVPAEAFLPDGDDQLAARRMMVADLTTRGLSYRCFVSPPATGRDAPRLSPLGERLYRAVTAHRPVGPPGTPGPTRHAVGVPNPRLAVDATDLATDLPSPRPTPFHIPRPAPRDEPAGAHRASTEPSFSADVLETQARGDAEVHSR